MVSYYSFLRDPQAGTPKQHTSPFDVDAGIVLGLSSPNVMRILGHLLFIDKCLMDPGFVVGTYFHRAKETGRKRTIPMFQHLLRFPYFETRPCRVSSVIADCRKSNLVALFRRGVVVSS